MAIASKSMDLFFFHEICWSKNYAKRINVINSNGQYSEPSQNIKNRAFCKNCSISDV